MNPMKKINQTFARWFAMSEEGGHGVFISVIWTSLQFLCNMLPMMLGSLLLAEGIRSLFFGLPFPQTSPWVYLAIGMAIVVVLTCVNMRQYDSSYTRIYGEGAKTRITLAETLRKLPMSFFGKKDVADLSATIMEDATQIEQLFSHAVPQIFASGLSILVIALMMFLYAWQLALAIFWVVPVALVVFALSRRMQGKIHADLYHRRREISDAVQEGMDNAQVIQAAGREKSYLTKVHSQLDDYEKTMMRTELRIGTVVQFSHLILHLGLPTLLLVGAGMIANGGGSPQFLFDLILYLIVAGRIYNPVMEFLNNFAALMYLNVRIARIREMNELPRQTGTETCDPLNHDIVFDHVSFSYEEDVQTLQDVSFTARQGQVTALVGPSGGGKTTVARLAARFWDVDSGKITLGGVDVSTVDPEALLQHFSIVFQDVTLFDDTILENIRLGRKDATDEEVLAAAQAAECDEFAHRLPQGYLTKIGENGERLSGGERQRISIARAMLKGAPVILLDEATSSLDAENERKIQSALSRLVKDKTVLIIAHRMRTISGADKVVVLRDGTVAEQGNPKELMAQDSIFAAMVKTQLAGEEGVNG